MTYKLYQFEQCPFCEKVRQYLKQNNIECELVNVSYDRESDERKMLLEKSGVGTVPVLQDNDTFIGDSDKIIAYLDNKQ